MKRDAERKTNPFAGLVNLHSEHPHHLQQQHQQPQQPQQQQQGQAQRPSAFVATGSHSAMSGSSAHLHHVHKSNPSGGVPTGAHGTHGSSCGPTGSGVRRWAHKLLLRGITGSSVPASPVTNGCSGGLKLSTSLSIPGSRHNPFASFRSSATSGANDQSIDGGPSAAMTGSYPPPLPPKQTRHKKPVPPPRTSSFLTRPKSGGEQHQYQQDLSQQQHQSQAQYHGDFIRSRPVTPTMVAADGTLVPVKSVRFGREVANAATSAIQGGSKDALDDATIGLEIAANLALAFARDVRRERIAAATGASSSPAPPPVPPEAAAGSAGSANPLRSSAYGRLYSSGRAGTGQEVTLSEFYQLLKYVGQGHAVDGLATTNTTTCSSGSSGDARSTHSSSSAFNGAAAVLTSRSSATKSPLPSTGDAVTRPTTPVATPIATATPCTSNQHLPPGYLTSRSFRHKGKRSQSQTPTPEPQLLRSRGDLSRRSASTSEDVSYDNLSPTTSTCPSVDSAGCHPPLRTRSLPRSHPSRRSVDSLSSAAPEPSDAGGGSAATPTNKPVRNWNEILHLIGQVISEQYPPSGTGTGAGSGTSRLPTSSESSGALAGKTTQRRYQRPCSGSLSDSEETYHRRRNQPEAVLARERHYDTLKPTSAASASRAEDNQSYLASLTHRLQIEQYIVKTLNHITASTRAPTAGASSSSSSSVAGSTPSNAAVAVHHQVDSYVECWGSPERGSRPKLTREVSKIGLERALLRLDHRRTERHPRIYQHHHWRITPPECNALFLCKMSDDDRLSLTTAVSDDDDGGESDGAQASPFRKSSAAAASFNCTGAVRKAGFLSVKKWLLRKKHQVELARKRGWRGYWVCLKGTTLLFYPCDSRDGRHVEAAPKHLIIVDGAIMQPIPEHPQRDFIFCLSTAFGDAYLFQAPCQAELDTWVNSIHSACAAAFARHRGKTGTLHLLQEEILRLDRSIESDNKLKHMAELQLSVVSESENRRQIGAQISAWEENLERLHCEQFRLRCYMASLQHGELPNPKSLLTYVSRSTKNTLNRLGVFTVSSFHAYICARSPSLLNNLLAGRGATRRRAVAPVLSRSNSLSSRKSQSIGGGSSSQPANDNDKLFKVNLPDGQAATVTLKENMTVEEFLASACGKRGLNAAEHFVRVKKRRDMDNSNHFVPHRTDLIDSYVPSHEIVEICTKALYQVELSRNNLEQMWGFSVEAELVENSERQDELCVFVSRVEDRSVAMNHGIIKGDEIMVINGALVGDLDMMYIESVLQEELTLSLMIRSCRADPPDVTCLLRTTDDLIDSLVCPPPPSDQLITDDILSNLIVPAPSWQGHSQPIMCDPPGAFPTEVSFLQRHSPSEISNPAQRSVQRMSERSSTSTVSEVRRSSPTGSVASSQSQAVTPNRQLSDGEKLKKCILELVETERTYVKHLSNLLESYLEPLKKETFLSASEINALFGNINEIYTFQRLFQTSLEEALALEPNFDTFDQPSQFKNILFAIGNAFLFHTNHFKLYSSFCASHSKAQKVLLPSEGSQALQEFLQSRNPRQQHSSTLESYLIKPIQRILKYPLLLQQLRNLTEATSNEHQHLVEALKGMEKVAEHINEMQRIHEEYGAIFDHLFRQHSKSCKQPVDLSPAELLYYGGVEWLNISDFLGKVKKGLELHAMCFVFKSAVVFLCKERLRQRKKLMSVATKSTAPEVEIIRYQVLIPVTEVQVRTAQAKDMESHYLWELIHLKNPLHRRSEKVYHLSNSTSEFRNAFLKTIRQIIRESVRNMSIPPAKPAITSSSTPPTPKMESLKNSKSSDGSASGGKSKRNMQRHSAGTIDYDNLDTCSSALDVSSANADDEPVVMFRGRSQTIGENKKLIRRMDSMETKDSDPGVKSENEDEYHIRSKPSLGRTPNHLSLSTTSTLSTGSSSSQARLIQASRTPQTFTPVVTKPLGSPIWKPREGLGESLTLPRPSKTTFDMPTISPKTAYGTLGHPSKK